MAGGIFCSLFVLVASKPPKADLSPSYSSRQGGILSRDLRRRRRLIRPFWSEKTSQIERLKPENEGGDGRNSGCHSSARVKHADPMQVLDELVLIVRTFTWAECHQKNAALCMMRSPNSSSAGLARLAAASYLGCSMDLKLKGKRAFVSGSTAGIGFAFALGLAQEGAEVVVNRRTAGWDRRDSELHGRRSRQRRGWRPPA